MNPARPGPMAFACRLMVPYVTGSGAMPPAGELRDGAALAPLAPIRAEPEGW